MTASAKPLLRPRLDEDVISFTEYRKTLNDCFLRTARTHRPIVITQNGRSTSVMMSVADFENTWNEIENWRKRAALSRMIEVSRKEFENGEFLSEEESFREIEKMIAEENSTKA